MKRNYGYVVWWIFLWLASVAGYGCVKQTPPPAAAVEKPSIPLPEEILYPPVPDIPKIVPPRKNPGPVPNPEKTAVPELPPARMLPSDKICMTMKDVDLRLLLRTLARIGGQSMMISENIRGTATLSVQNESWRKVFLGVLRTHNLTWTLDGKIIRVIALEDVTNELKWLEVQAQKASRERDLEQIRPFRTQVRSIRFADAENLVKILENLLIGRDGKKQGNIMLDTHTNSLIIQADEKDMAGLLALVDTLDRPTAQIRIEARIVEASSDTARELGIEWGGLAAGTNGSTDYRIGPGLNTTSSSTTSTTTASTATTATSLETLSTPGLIQRLPAVAAKDAGLLLGIVAQQGNDLLMLQLSALETQGKVRILSSPSISTVDNQMALIESGREVPYQTVEDDEVNVEFKKAALRLEVTPHVIDGQILKMKIVTSKDELDFSNTVEGNPTVLTKRAETTVLLHDGQTTVIGGLRKENRTRSESGVPVLKDIPLLGRLFRKENDSSAQEEILIFITPHILNDKDMKTDVRP